MDYATIRRMLLDSGFYQTEQKAPLRNCFVEIWNKGTIQIEKTLFPTQSVVVVSYNEMDEVDFYISPSPVNDCTEQVLEYLNNF